MDLNLIRTLVDIVDAGNLSEAARRRDVTRSQISKELKNLERQVGATLLRRTTRKLAPTEQGRTLYEHGLRMLAEVESARAAIDRLGQTVRGHVRISIPTGLGEFFVGPRLLDFQRAHPEVSLRVLFSNRVFDLIGTEIDIALRITSEPPLDQVARRICAIRWGLYAAPSYLAGHAPIAEPEDLAACVVLYVPGPERHFMMPMHRGAQRRDLRLKLNLQTEHFPYLRSAVLAGTGIGLLPRYAMTDDVRAARAVPVLPQWEPEGLGNALYILTMPDRHPSHAAVAVMDYLREVLASMDDGDVPDVPDVPAATPSSAAGS
ncbi:MULTISPECIES: LysR family transcriptional regulator [unclassified Variovorax]|uniref:LysR family transcriptional regulator n=1 Tax=unclassified Variovorax TaxID=663243 RepID=UPI000B8202B1|nr:MULTISPECIES: LysR family transcriptional regulator [unclassified Variovorax]